MFKISPFPCPNNTLKADDLKAETIRTPLPLPEAYPADAPRKITEEERNFEAYRTLRMARANQRNEGIRKIRAAKVSLSSILSLLSLTFRFIEKGGGGSKEEVVVLFFFCTCQNGDGRQLTICHAIIMTCCHSHLLLYTECNNYYPELYLLYIQVSLILG